jgi:hypothetical protein
MTWKPWGTAVGSEAESDWTDYEREDFLRRTARIMGLVLLVAMMLSAFSGTALAASPRAECEAAGGTFAKVQGTQTCTFAEVPGSNQGGVVKDNRGGRHCPGGQQT